MFFSLCFSFFIFGSSAKAQDLPAEETPAATESAEKTKASKVGAWLEESRASFIKTCSGNRPENIDEATMKKVCSCTLDKLEQLYLPKEIDSPEAQQKSNSFISTCYYGSKGAWSQTFKANFTASVFTQCMDSRPESIAENSMRNICSCSINMIESKYSPQSIMAGAEGFSDFATKAKEICAKQELNR